MTAPDQGGVLFGPFGAPETAGQVPLPNGIALAALEHIRQEYETGTMAHDTASKALEDTFEALAAQERPAPGDELAAENRKLRERVQILLAETPRDFWPAWAEEEAEAAAQERPAPGELPPSELTDVLAEILAFLGEGISPGDEFALQVAAWRKRADRAIATLAVTAAERDDLAQQCDNLRNLLDDFTHAVIDLDAGRGGNFAKAAHSVRKKTGLPPVEGK